MKKLVRKGFTLVELVIVMALFSLVMYGVLQFLDPVSKFFVRSSNFETTTACVDNIRRAIEGNLKYADRVESFALFGDDTIEDNVEKFWEKYFEGRELIDCKGEIYVLAFKNFNDGRPSDWDGLSDLNDYGKNKYNIGEIDLTTYHFDKTGFSRGGTDEWYVNQKMYGNYNYYFTLGPASAADQFGIDKTTAPFDPSDCTITITSKPIVRNKSTGKLEESTAENTAVASFSMKNVLDPTKHYTSPMMDYKIIRNPDTNHDAYKLSDDGSTFEKIKYVISSTGGINRYQELKSNDNTATQKQMFYFIFTQPETVYDAGEMVYGSASESGVVTIKPITTPGFSFVKPKAPEDDKITTDSGTIPIYDKTYLEQVKKAYEDIEETT